MTADIKKIAEDLKPCPFCGGEGIAPVSSVRADGAPDTFICEGCGGAGPCGEDEAEAITAWNRRVVNDAERHEQCKAWVQLVCVACQHDNAHTSKCSHPLCVCERRVSIHEAGTVLSSQIVAALDGASLKALRIAARRRTTPDTEER